jgi:hypothetical protein
VFKKKLCKGQRVCSESLQVLLICDGAIAEAPGVVG